jgi:hypothetical protein
VPNWLSADSESVMIAEDSTFLCRIDLAGRLQWRVPIYPANFSVTVQNQIVAGCTATSNQLFALDRTTGKTLWQVELLDAAQQPPVIFNDRISIATIDGVEVRSLIDGSLRKSVSLGPTRNIVFMNHDRFLASTAQGELVFGSLLTGSTERQSLGLNPIVSPKVGTNAVVYAVGEGELMWLSLDNISNPKRWFSSGPDLQPAAGPFLSADRAYVSVRGQGLVCLESGVDES